jgi:hypothetical protein
VLLANDSKKILCDDVIKSREWKEQGKEEEGKNVYLNGTTWK